MKALSKRRNKWRSITRGAFSMLELVFVIIILGILAAIAIPRLSFTRADAQLIAVENDIVSAINAIQREVLVKTLSQIVLTGRR